ncbi:hypothetical protein AV955_gp007 [Diadromus pulchellus ascovirus 4a]|uniref:Complete DpAV4 genome n=2 Tax=Diadromus pulchellus ascovirus 4a TaxID=158683 RepID=F2NYT6_9VIRU|nr:hypothetical protein AV955_gp007 [Diadromus pulchellus ascovirus 4a]CCA61364.1 unnamed protein product [Diadromus pulchellus ascovirus 4a]
MEDRLKTFNRKWKGCVEKTKMAEAGFVFVQEPDIARCAFCGLEVSGWDAPSDPETLHLRLNRTCPLILKKFFVNDEARRLETFSSWNGEVCSRKLAAAGFVHLKGDGVVCSHCNLKLNDWKCSDDPEICHRELRPKCIFSKKDVVEKAAVNRNMECVICLDETKNVAYLPCGHVATCLSCSIKQIDRKCPLCSSQYVSKFRVYF